MGDIEVLERGCERVDRHDGPTSVGVLSHAGECLTVTFVDILSHG